MDSFTAFDFTAFFKASADNAPWVLAVVLGLVTFWGKLGVKGVWQLVSSMLTGLLIGGMFDIAALGLPADFAGWFSVSMYGIAMGLVASLGYETGKEVVLKIITKTLGIPEDLHKG